MQIQKWNEGENKRTKFETVFTSTRTKLLNHLDRLELIQKKNIWKPITLHLSPTDKCNLNCVFCSIKNRTPHELDFDKLKIALRDFKDIGLRGVEITGGGDPTMYHKINELIDYIHKLNMSIGMITNGVALKRTVSKENIAKMTWIRISLNSLDYVPDIDIPEIPENVTLGFSYVWNKFSKMKKLKKIAEYKKKHGAEYVRVVPDCLKVQSIDKYMKIIPKMLKELNEEGFFFQTKNYDKPKVCRIGYLKPYLGSNGNIYHCTAQVLIQRDYNPDFIMGKYNNIKKIWKNVKPFNTKSCGECFFREHNELLEDIITNVPHRDFV